MVTVSATPVSPAATGDFQQTGTTLTMEPAGRRATGTVTIAAVNNTVDAPDKSVDVAATVAGGNGVSTVTATLSGPSSAQVTVTVSATADASRGGIDGESGARPERFADLLPLRVRQEERLEPAEVSSRRRWRGCRSGPRHAP